MGLTRKGLPKILPNRFRSQIASRNLETIRLVRTLLKSYTAFIGTHPAQDLRSVTDPEPVLNQEKLIKFSGFCKDIFWPKVIRGWAKEAKRMDLLKPDISDFNRLPYVGYSAGPNNSTSFLGAPLDALAWLIAGASSGPGDHNVVEMILSLQKDIKSAYGLPTHLKKWLEITEQ